MKRAAFRLSAVLVLASLLGCSDKGPEELGGLIEKGDLAGVKRMLDERPELLEKPWENVRTQGGSGGVSSGRVDTIVIGRPLFLAARDGQLEVARALIERGADIEGLGQYGATPLMAAASTGGGGSETRAAIVDLLLAKGANPEATDTEGTRPLHAAANWACCYTDTLERLLAIPVDIHATSESGWTALHVAADNYIEGAALLCGAGADPTARNAKGERPIERAREAERTDIVTYLEHPDGCVAAARIGPKFTDPVLRTKALVAAAECLGGEAKRCTNAGVALAGWKGDEIDRPLAKRYFERGCEGGSAIACYDVGLALEQGWEGEKDPAAAAKAYRKGCAGEHAKSCDRLAKIEGS